MTDEDHVEVSNVDEPAPQVREESDGVKSEAHANVRPWVRFFARLLDYTIFIGVISFFTLLFDYPLLTIAPPMPFLILVFIWAFIEAAFISGCRTTPGKALLGISVQKDGGRKLSYGESLSRALSVWLLGMGAGIPIVYLVTWIVACVKLSNNGVTTWDKRGDIAVHHKKLEWYRIAIAVGIFLIAGYFNYAIYG